MAKVMTSGGEALIRALADENVDIIFGYPGGAALHIYDAIYQQDRVQHILVRHEQAATHAADGFARATGKPGVCLSLGCRCNGCKRMPSTPGCRIKILMGL